MIVRLSLPLQLSQSRRLKLHRPIYGAHPRHVLIDPRQVFFVDLAEECPPDAR
jgi:hypothetical protein